MDDCKNGGLFLLKKFDVSLFELFVENISFKTLKVSLKNVKQNLKNIKITSFLLENECKLNGAD